MENKFSLWESIKYGFVNTFEHFATIIKVMITSWMVKFLCLIVTFICVFGLNSVKFFKNFSFTSVSLGQVRDLKWLLSIFVSKYFPFVPFRICEISLIHFSSSNTLIQLAAIISQSRVNTNFLPSSDILFNNCFSVFQSA